MLDEVRCRQALSEAFPGLDLRSVRYFNAGWDCELWEINNDLLFRFPLRQECAGPLSVEARLLPELALHVSLAMPAPLYYSDGVAAFPLPFFAYRKLPGVGMHLAELTSGQLANVAQQLANFLSELHTFPAERAAALGVNAKTSAEWRERFVRLRARVQIEVSSLLAADEADRLEAFWQRFLARHDYFVFAPALIHGDLAPEHVLIDANGSVSGIMDFGDARVGDPALDFAGFDASLRGLVASRYRRAPDPTLNERAEIYRTIISPLNYLLFGQERRERSLIDEGLQRLRQSLAVSR